VGYPVAVKAQAAALSHKTESGGVVLGVADETALRREWATLRENVARAQPRLGPGSAYRFGRNMG
jgi:acyl-CoA synthetase (NDP forming)